MTAQDTEDTAGRRSFDPLGMARNLASQVGLISEYIEAEGLDEHDAAMRRAEAHATGLGGKQRALGEMAGQIAWVSIAVDARRIADALERIASGGQL